MSVKAIETGPHFTYRAIVDFADTDLAGIMHFANFFRFMERAEHAFWRSIGLSVHGEIDGRTISWPRVSATCDYKQPLRFEDELAIEVSVREIRSKAVVFGFKFKRAASDEIAAEGAVTAVCAARDDDAGRMRAVHIPPSVLKRLEAVAGA
jgi:acyl-CoA thioester hydrolase